MISTRLKDACASLLPCVSRRPRAFLQGLQPWPIQSSADLLQAGRQFHHQHKRQKHNQPRNWPSAQPRSENQRISTNLQLLWPEPSAFGKLPELRSPLALRSAREIPILQLLRSPKTMKGHSFTLVGMVGLFIVYSSFPESLTCSIDVFIPHQKYKKSPKIHHKNHQSPSHSNRDQRSNDQRPSSPSCRCQVRCRLLASTQVPPAVRRKPRHLL